MFLGTVLDIVIGLFFTYLILSLIASEIQEQLATLRESRAVHLKDSIRILLGENKKSSPLTDGLYEHYLIKGLNQYSIRAFRLRIEKNSEGPSYIPPETFATALIDVILLKLKEAERKFFLETCKNLTEPETDEPTSSTETNEETNSTESETDKSTTNLIEIINELIEKLNLLHQRTEIEISTTFLEEWELTLAIQKLLKNNFEDTNIKNLPDAIKVWYEQAMERSTGVYKRNVKGLTLLIGLIIAVLININTFNIIDALSKDEKLRNSLVEASIANLSNESLKKCIKEQKQDTSEQKQNTSEQKQDTSEQNKDTSEQTQDTSKPSNNLNCPKEIQEYLKTTKDLFAPLPIGTGVSPNIYEIFSKTKSQTTGQQQNSAQSWIMAIVGWLITGIAVSMGAPFWFDILNKFVNVRNTGTPILNPDPKKQPSSSEEK